MCRDVVCPCDAMCISLKFFADRSSLVLWMVVQVGTDLNYGYIVSFREKDGAKSERWLFIKWLVYIWIYLCLIAIKKWLPMYSYSARSYLFTLQIAIVSNNAFLLYEIVLSAHVWSTDKNITEKQICLLGLISTFFWYTYLPYRSADPIILDDLMHQAACFF